MPRALNPYNSPYQRDDSLSRAVGSLGTALFGDPEAAAMQARQRAQMESDAASAEYNRARAQGQAIENDAYGRLTPEAFTGLVTRDPATGAASINEEGLAALFSGLAQSHNKKPGDTIGALMPFLAGGDDTINRASLIAQGSSPAEKFAATSGRADQIAGRDASSSLAQAIATANISAGTSRANNADNNALALQMNEADNNRAMAVAEADNLNKMEIAGLPGKGKAVPKFSPAQLGNMDAEIAAQAPGLEGSLATAVRVRAVELALQSGNPAGAIQQALQELVSTTPGEGGWFFDTPPSYAPAQAAPTVIKFDAQGNRIQ